MTRYARTINIATGEETLVPFTPEEEAAADAAYEAEQKALAQASADQAGVALDDRRREAAKEEITELVEQGDLATALKKALELI